MTETAQINIEELSFPREQKTCGGYKIDSIGVDFTYREFPKGCRVGAEQAPAHQLLLILEGSCTIHYEKFPERSISGGEMILIRRHGAYSVQVSADLKLLIMSFENVLNDCDKLALKAYDTYRSGIEYNFMPTQIRQPLTEFCSFLVYLLHSSVNCAHLHELKHKELFLCLKWFYSKEEIAYLLYEIIDHSFDFRRVVYENCDKVGSVNDLIRLMNMSRSLFFRRFRQEFGITAYQWMLKHRCDKIIRALANPDVCIDNLYERFGYASKESFHNFCKREFGCTPQQLIERYQQV